MKRPTLRTLPASLLEVRWPEAQRPERTRRVNKIAAEFDWTKFGVLHVTSANGNGKHHIIDGQHRLAAAVIHTGSDQVKVPCLVHDNVQTATAAAGRFDGLNDQKNPSALDKFLVRITAGENMENEINDLVRSRGMKIDGHPSDGHIACVAALENLYKLGGIELVADTIDVIDSAWGTDRDAYHSFIVSGVGELLRYTDGVDIKRLVTRMQKSTSPGQLIGRARGISDALGVSKPKGVAHALLTIHNTGLRSGRVEPWF